MATYHVIYQWRHNRGLIVHSGRMDIEHVELLAQLPLASAIEWRVQERMVGEHPGPHPPLLERVLSWRKK